jgi:hypothetical protein
MSNTGTVRRPDSSRGAFDPSRVNFFCASCRSFVQAPLGVTGIRACPTLGCDRPDGFGVYAMVPRPTANGGETR